MDIELQHIIYTLVPYRGYAVRAWSSKEVVYDVDHAFKSWFSPYEQAIVRPGYELRAVVRSPKDYLYLARVFMGERLDELKRSGVVSHIVAIPINILIDKKIPLEHIDKAMYDYATSKGIGLGEIEPIKIAVDENQVDPDIEYFKKTVTIENARKILAGISRPYGRVIAIYRRDVWSRIKLAYAISKVLASTHTLKEFIVLTDKPIDNILIEYENLVIVLDKMIPIKQTGEWTVVKVVDEEKERRELDIEEILKKIYS